MNHCVHVYVERGGGGGGGGKDLISAIVFSWIINKADIFSGQNAVHDIKFIEHDNFFLALGYAGSFFKIFHPPPPPHTSQMVRS